MAQEHVSTISVAMEENEEQTTSQSWGSDAVSGAGVVWYHISVVNPAFLIGGLN